MTRRDELDIEKTTPLWTLTEFPPKVDRPTDVAALDIGLPPGNANWIFSRFAPHTDAPLHRTDAISFSAILSGTVVSVLEAEEVTLEPGDFFVLEGTMHGWKTGDEPCTMATIAFGLEP
ncbi:hypothetical protein GCM10010472_02040 [Pseudonocardia halophobica]|uniref:Cupin type-2 domain-containing protein n=1 Tax=Pseudonocardia halophobica TaxID=29401 RepID=A0A9W6NV69_9PSEU|nr:hypothetical protein GCM10017577_16840 [Pseudonocardia halophobica]